MLSDWLNIAASQLEAGLYGADLKCYTPVDPYKSTRENTQEVLLLII